MSVESGSPEALLKAMRTSGMKFKQENYEFIEAFTTRIGISNYEPVRKPSKRYVRATRIDGGRTLFIYFGFTTGFLSEEEILVEKALRQKADPWWRPWWQTLSGDPDLVAHLGVIRQASGALHLSLLRVADIVVWMTRRPAGARDSAE